VELGLLGLGQYVEAEPQGPLVAEAGHPRSSQPGLKGQPYSSSSAPSVGRRLGTAAVFCWSVKKSWT
jgi:hypothetical protein